MAHAGQEIADEDAAVLQFPKGSSSFSVLMIDFILA